MKIHEEESNSVSEISNNPWFELKNKAWSWVTDQCIFNPLILKSEYFHAQSRYEKKNKWFDMEKTDNVFADFFWYFS
ncbi:CLUMA_CG010900, isoform A [Clunio marinus]|uniref:CLUMA_CG010900, isoform A n=1 Tax=Clunio marinus TaxID=568069 RepID=A0A1J1IB43_9DIPT|nr:CLUMA_CG010900, isoform A [Clunio marinus]